MYDLVGYGSMLADAGRTSAYARALEARITPSSVVLDIGAGPGILALLACRAGAARVYAVESSDIIQVARDVAVANGCVDRIRFVHGVSTEIDLPERVDGIVADLHGSLPLSGSCIVSILDARDRFLKRGGWIVPGRETLRAAIASSASAHALVHDAWKNAYGIDFSAAHARAIHHWRKTWLSASDLITSPEPCATFEYDTLNDASLRCELAWRISQAAVAHGLAVWFDAETAPGITLSNSPAAGGNHVYGQTFFSWPDPVTLSDGDAVAVQLRADFSGSDYIWSWHTRIIDACGSLKAEYRQSSFYGQAMSPETLRKRADGFIPEMTDDGLVDRCVLNLMTGRASLNEIAERIRHEFPDRFRDHQAALDRVADLSEKYGKSR